MPPRLDRPIIVMLGLLLPLLASGPASGQAGGTPARPSAEEAAARRAALVARVLASGDGSSAATAYTISRAYDGQIVVEQQRWRFLRLRSVPEPGHMLDIWTVRDPSGGEREVFFRAPASETLDARQAQSDRDMRRILTSGDGLTPQTAFIVGGVISAEYAILRLMHLRRGVQALQTQEGCGYDVQHATDEETGERRAIWFLLGNGSGYTGMYNGQCASHTPPPAR